MHWLLHLYPRKWRERYEEEMLALLEDHKITAATIIDLLIGALDANLHYDGGAEGVLYMVNRLRSGMVMVFCAFIMFGLGWSLLQRINDPVNLFQAAAKLHPEFIILHKAIFIVGCLAFLAFLIGGLPVFFISLKRAIKSSQKEVLNAFRIAVSCLILFMISTGILADWHHLPFARNHMIAFLIGYFTLFLVLLLTGTVSVSFMIARTDFQLSELKLVFIPEIVIFFSILATAVLSLIFILTLIANAPQLFSTQDVGSSMFIIGILLMALAAIFAAMGLKRGNIRGRNQLTRD